MAGALPDDSVHDSPYCLRFVPGHPDRPGQYLVQVMLAVPEDRTTDRCWLDFPCGTK